mmetsp:Transcript_35813/g.89398  ORF Transcript_35813/g.89398 Transcript_35813/m.89398 type:complete len:251 (-) Transcript_35813:595-1347(-)
MSSRVVHPPRARARDLPLIQESYSRPKVFKKRKSPRASPTAPAFASSSASLADDHVVKAVHLVLGADAQSSSLIHGVDPHVEDRAAGDAVRGLTPRLLHQEPKGRRLERQPQLRRGLVRRGVGEDAHVLSELLVHIRHQAAGVTQSVLVVDVVVHQFLVPRELGAGAHVGGGEDARVLVNGDLFAGADPRLECAVRELAALRGAPVGELVHAVVQANKHCGARTIEGDERGDLVAARGADESVLARARLL